MTALTLILPCFNEAERLPATLATYLAQLPTAPAAAEVLVVDDGAYGPGELERVVQAPQTAPVAIGTRGPDSLLGQPGPGPGRRPPHARRGLVVRRELGPGQPSGGQAYAR